MIIKWLSKWFDDSTDSIVYPMNEWDQGLKEKVMKYEQGCKKLGIRLQEKYQDLFFEKGLLNFEIKVSRCLDGDEFDHLTEQDCFKEMYYSRLVVRYNGDKKFLENGKDADQAVESIWHRGNKEGYLTHLTIEEIEESLVEKIEEILFSVEEKMKY
jgi:hypothetical protein